MTRTVTMPDRFPVPERERWSVLRAGIQNVWEYDDRRFVFHHGRLLLRGQNEAGKTKAMELLFPLLLDADLAPQRIDPFGSVSRPMRWNLINEADPETNLRIGYLWLELGRLQDSEPVFCTVGAGVKARRGAPDVESWFFVTAQRPDRDVHFIVEGRPLVRRELAEAIGSHGQVFERNGDYRRAVNNRLFGMADEQYGALIDTLLQLRRPQLSKTLDLGALSGLLASSLPPLDTAVVGPIAEGFERIDHHRADLEALEETLRKLREFDAVYREYARIEAKLRAVAVTSAESAYQRARGEAKERSTERDGFIARSEELDEEITGLERAERGSQERIRTLEGSDAYRAAKDLDDAEQTERHATKLAEEARQRRDEDARARDQADRRRRDAADEASREAAEVESARAISATAARDAALEGAHGAVDEASARGEHERAAAALGAIMAGREEVLTRLRALAKALAVALEAHRRAEERARDRETDLAAAKVALDAAERLREEAEAAWVEAVEAWLATLVSLPPVVLPGAFAESPDPASFRVAAEAAGESVRRTVGSERGAAAARRDEMRQRIEALRNEREALERASHPVPVPPTWRGARPADRPGAPLYLVCDFGPAATGNEGAIEGALESSGLLDAWIEPDGTVLHPFTNDAILRGATHAGRTLADVLVPVASGSITMERAGAALRTIAYADAGETPDASAWVAADGRWRLGALNGAWTKTQAGYVGATAREAERRRRIADLDARVASLEAEARDLDELVATLDARLDRLAAELRSLPQGADIETARARVAARADAHGEAQKRFADAEHAFGDAELRRDRAALALDQAAADAGLVTFARDPDLLAMRTRSYQVSAEALVSAAREWQRAVATERRDAEALDEASWRAARSRDAAARAEDEATTAAARARALRDASGRARDEVLDGLRKARLEAEEARAKRASAERDVRELAEAVGKAREAAAQAEAQVGTRESERKAAASRFRALATSGFLANAGFAAGGLEEASFTEVLETARGVDARTDMVASPEERERAEDRVVRRHADLGAQLPADVRLLPSRAGDLLTYEFTWNGRTRPAAEILADMEADATARKALLGAEEAQLLEDFLSGEAHDHLATRLRAARSMVDRMNDALEERTTAAGAQVRLSWTLDEGDAQADAREAVPLFLRAGHLLTEAHRGALHGFLQRRLQQARDAQGDRSLQERLLDVLDYRTWHRFEVEHREPGRPWAKLTRKVHAAGSGGKKAVMLHLPLFAAAAAFYDSAGPTAPRIIALDEAFAGIDRPTRGKLMGLLAEFDLDFIMTSFEEWGFYEELDGLSTYHLAREPGHRGVFAEWFVWNGRERMLVEES